MTDKVKALEKALKKLKDKHPNASVTFGEVHKVDWVPTPFPTLNALNGGGLPRGKFGTIAGASQTGKSSLLTQIIAHAQQQDPDFRVLWTDAEASVDFKWLTSLGVDPDRFIVQQYDPDRPYMEALMDDALSIIQTHSVDMWVIDSIGALEPKADEEKSIEENKMLNLQRKLGEFFRKAIKTIAPTSDWSGCACVLIGQVYSVPTTTGVGLEEVRGGNSVKHWAHYRFKIRRGNRQEGPDLVSLKMPDGEVRKVVPGWAQHVKLEKSKLNDKEGQEIILQFVYGRGIDSTNSAITALIANGVVERNGPMYYHKSFLNFPDACNSEGKIRGRDATIKFLSDNSDLRDELVKEMDQVLTENLSTVEEDTENSVNIP
jgi:RecA/RadA recombinase